MMFMSSGIKTLPSKQGLSPNLAQRPFRPVSCDQNGLKFFPRLRRRGSVL
jgi:hypothetical protein